MFERIPTAGEKRYTASVYILSQEQPPRVLLVHHKKIDRWLPPGGHQEPNETPIDTAIRETREETGIDVTKYMPSPQPMDNRAKNLPVPQFILEEKIDAHGDQPEHYHLDMTYVVQIPHQPATIQENESYAVGWFTADEIDSLPIFENVAQMAKELLAIN